jgi:glycosyltransferase involved in cell wall biosynthesis
MRDNRLAATLHAAGRDVVLMPLYTPLRTDERDVSRSPIYYGGINVFLQQRSALLRRLPRWLTAWLDSPAILRRAMRFSGSTGAAELGAMTVSVLRGEQGAQRKELEHLIDGLRLLKPDLINLPFLMFVGLARPLKDAFAVPVVCTLSGEDIFLDELPEPHRGEARRLIREGAEHVDGLIAVSRYYAQHATRHFDLPADRVHVVPLGVQVEDFAGEAQPPASPFTIGYLARICPAKGLMNLCEALVELRRMGRDCRIRAAGYLGATDRWYLGSVRAYLRDHSAAEAFDYGGEVDRAGKIELLRSSHVFSVPTAYREAKGVFVIEALAAGVPVVQPRHGSFPELIETTGGGLLYDPADNKALAQSIARLMDDDPLRRQLGQHGRAGVRASFTDTAMAEKTWTIYESIRAQHRP